VAVLLVLAAAVFAAADTALSRVSRATVDELARAGMRGAGRLSRVVADPARYINVALFLRTVCEILATVLVARVCLERLPEGWEGGWGGRPWGGWWFGTWGWGPPRGRSPASTRRGWRSPSPARCPRWRRCSVRSHGC